MNKRSKDGRLYRPAAVVVRPQGFLLAPRDLAPCLPFAPSFAVHTEKDQKKPGVTGLTYDRPAQSVCRVPSDLPDERQWLIDERQRVGRCIRDHRLHHNLTQQDVYLAVPLARSYYQEVESGVANPTLDTLTAIARVVGVSLPELVRDPAAEPGDTSAAGS
ncbi:helix-turn-helix domain-containing protein [Streptomyces sp. NPDC101112]|uniref:helix-turn-helix domain-containing protein n=1 Tax=Streptomyces sp. NPDC101112 TaxID=3366105 RepID=UPI003822C6F6